MNNIGFGRMKDARRAGGKQVGKRQDTAMDPNDLIDSIVDAIDYAEIAKDTQGLNKARRLLNNELRQAIDVYVQDEVIKALGKRHIPTESGAKGSRSLAASK